MRRIKEEKQKIKIEKFLENWNETMIWSYQQGYMGEGFADDLDNPKMVGILLGDFYFLAGNSEEKEAFHFVEEIEKIRKKDFLLVIPKEKEWGEIIQRVYGKRAEKIVRYAIKKERDIFDIEKLKQYIKVLEPGFSLKRIEGKWYQQCRKEDWAKDFCVQFQDEKDFKSRGLGIVAVKDGRIVSGASSYSVYKNGIEIEIDTKKEYRRRGLALACAAKLILLCLERDWYPSWDAANMDSVRLAEKLGYHFDREYPTYFIK